MTRSPAPPFPPELLQLDEQIGKFMEYWGFKRIHGRVWLHLYVSDSPLDVAELMRRLKVSKTLMSFCIRDLKHYGVIREAGIIRHGTVIYEANPDLLSVVQNVLRVRERPLLGRIRASHQLAASLPEAEQKSHGLQPRRMRELGKLIAGADRALQTLVRVTPAESAIGGGLLALFELFGPDSAD